MIDTKLNNDVSLAKNNNNSLAATLSFVLLYCRLLIIWAGLVHSYVQQFHIIVNCFCPYLLFSVVDFYLNPK